MISPPNFLRAVLDPLDGAGSAVLARKWLLPLLLLMGAQSLAGAAIALRWNPGPQVVQGLQASGELGRLSEREVLEKIELTQRLELVGGVARGLFAVPLLVLLAALGLKLGGWLIDRPVAFGAGFTAAAVAGLPLAILALLQAGAAWRQVELGSPAVGALIPSHLGAYLASAGGPGAASGLGRVWEALDLFKLWSGVLLGLGFAAAAGISRRRGLAMGFIFFAVYVGLFAAGLPGLMSGRPE
jgi:hypothetical protein